MDMKLRTALINSAKGDNLSFLWMLYRLRQRSGAGLWRGVLSLLLLRAARRHGGYIGPDCWIGAGAVLVGDIRVGRGVKVGAGAVVAWDIPDHCTVVAQPSRIIPPSPADAASR